MSLRSSPKEEKGGMSLRLRSHPLTSIFEGEQDVKIVLNAFLISVSGKLDKPLNDHENTATRALSGKNETRHEPQTQTS